jgi:hypothetical protein
MNKSLTLLPETRDRRRLEVNLSNVTLGLRGDLPSVALRGSAGSCAAGGDYQDRHGHRQGFVATAGRDGRWRTAIEVPGLAALDAGGHAVVTSVSCASPTSCAAGGDYTRGNTSQQGFVADENNGVWGTAIELPGLAALNNGGFVQVLSVSCGSPGSCVTGGDYTRHNLSLQGFVADENNGVWGTAIELPGLAALNAGGGAVVTSVSCGSTGSCAAGGEYTDRHHRGQGFVAAKLVFRRGHDGAVHPREPVQGRQGHPGRNVVLGLGLSHVHTIQASYPAHGDQRRLIRRQAPARFAAQASRALAASWRSSSSAGSSRRDRWSRPRVSSR